jgi:hypothetical protein
MTDGRLFVEWDKFPTAPSAAAGWYSPVVQRPR